MFWIYIAPPHIRQILLRLLRCLHCLPYCYLWLCVRLQLEFPGTNPTNTSTLSTRLIRAVTAIACAVVVDLAVADSERVVVCIVILQIHSAAAAATCATHRTITAIARSVVGHTDVGQRERRTKGVNCPAIASRCTSLCGAVAAVACAVITDSAVGDVESCVRNANRHHCPPRFGASPLPPSLVVLLMIWLPMILMVLERSYHPPPLPPLVGPAGVRLSRMMLLLTTTVPFSVYKPPPLPPISVRYPSPVRLFSDGPGIEHQTCHDPGKWRRRCLPWLCLLHRV